jgi:RNA polymerase sigma factor (sigma-70 family)
MTIATDMLSKPMITDPPKFEATDGELLAIYLETGDREPVLKLIRRHSPLIAATARRMTGNAQDAEDIFQSTFLVLIKSAHKIRKHKSLSAWLYGVCYRLCWQLRRQKSSRRETTEWVEGMDESTRIDPLSSLARQLEIEQLDHELHQLPEAMRGPLIDHYIGGQTAATIADQMDLSVSAVEGRLKRGRRLLRSRLAQRGVAFSTVAAAAAWFQTQVATATELGMGLDGGSMSAQWAESLCEQLEQTDDWQQPTDFGNTIENLVKGELAVKSSLILKSFLVLSCAGGMTGLLGMLAIAQNQSGNSGSATIVRAGSDAEVESMPATIVPIGSQSSRLAQTQSAPVPAGNSSDEEAGFRVFALKFISASDAEDMITELLDNPSNVRIATDSRGNSLVVSGNETQLSWIEKLLSKIDTPPEPNGLPSEPYALTSQETQWNTANESPEWLTNGQQIAQEYRETRSVLNEDVEVDFANTPLRTVLNEFFKTIGKRIIVNEADLTDMDLSSDEPVTLTLGSTRLSDALEEILRPLGLTYAIKPSYIRIVAAGNPEAVTLRYYDLSHLTKDVVVGAEIASLVQASLVQASVNASWEDEGGDLVCRMIGSTLAVQADEPAHLQIERVLSDLQAVAGENLTTSPRQPSKAMSGGGMF